MLGAAVARWLALRLVDVDAERELAVGDLARLAVILSRARDSRAATAFCERGGVSSLCALIDVESSPPLSAGTMFDCAKAIAGFCAALSDGSTTARFDVDGVARELRAILSSASGKMADPLPAVAATACRRALACLEKHAATRAGAATAVERQSSYGALGDCVAAAKELDFADASRSGSHASLHRAQKYDGSFGSQIDLSRTRSESLNSLDASFSSPTKLIPAASVPEASDTRHRALHHPTAARAKTIRLRHITSAQVQVPGARALEEARRRASPLPPSSSSPSASSSPSPTVSAPIARDFLRSSVHSAVRRPFASPFPRRRRFLRASTASIRRRVASLELVS